MLLDDGERTKPSEEGKQIAGKYHALWEIHSVKNFPVNLDVDFPRWDKQKFELNILISELAYYNEHARFVEILSITSKTLVGTIITSILVTRLIITSII